MSNLPPLHLACRDGNDKRVLALLKERHSPNARDVYVSNIAACVPIQHERTLCHLMAYFDKIDKTLFAFPTCSYWLLFSFVCVCVRVRACWYMGLYSSSKEGGCVQGKRRVQSEQKKEREIQDPKVEMSSSERNQQQQGESSAKDNGCCCLHNTNSKKQQQHAQQQRLRRRKKTGHRLVHGGKTGPSFQHPLTLRTSRNCKSGQ